MWSRRPRRATPWTRRPTASMSALLTAISSTPSPPRTRSCPASRSSRPQLPMALLWKMPFTPLRASLAPSAPPSPPGRMGAPWWRTSPPAFISSVRSPFRSRLCGLPVSRPSPCGPVKFPRHGLRITPGPDWRSSSEYCRQISHRGGHLPGPTDRRGFPGHGGHGQRGACLPGGGPRQL